MAILPFRPGGRDPLDPIFTPPEPPPTPRDAVPNGAMGEDDPDTPVDERIPELAAIPFTWEWLVVDDLKVDHGEYQRPAKPKQSDRINREFKPIIFDEPKVSRRADGDYIVDGQQRRDALQKRGYGRMRMLCKVYHGLTIEQEAELFSQPQSTQLRLIPAEKFRADWRRGDPVAVSIAQEVERSGFHLHLKDSGTNHMPSNTLDAVAALVHVRRQFGPAALPEVLDLLWAAWGHTHHRVKGSTVEGLALFCHRYDGAVAGPYDPRRVVQVLRAAGAMVLEQRVTELRNRRGDAKDERTGRAILELYNAHLRHRLPDWDVAKANRMAASHAR